MKPRISIITIGVDDLERALTSRRDRSAARRVLGRVHPARSRIRTAICGKSLGRIPATDQAKKYACLEPETLSAPSH